jgi:hypothetical protein
LLQYLPFDFFLSPITPNLSPVSYSLAPCAFDLSPVFLPLTCFFPPFCTPLTVFYKGPHDAIMIPNQEVAMKNYRFPVVVERNEEGYFAFCPELQGCYTQGEPCAP